MKTSVERIGTKGKLEKMMGKEAVPNTEVGKSYDQTPRMLILLNHGNFRIIGEICLYQVAKLCGRSTK
jgi:hypothetical protein